MIASRRSFLTGLGAALVAAPAIVRVASIMPVRQIPTDEILVGWVGQMTLTNTYLHTLVFTEDGNPIRFQGYDIFFDGGYPMRRPCEATEWLRLN